MRTIAFTLLAGVLGAGCACPPSPGAHPAERPGLPAAVAVDPAATPLGDAVVLCGVRDGRLVRVAGEVNAVTGDTLVAGRPLADALPAHLPPYAGTTEWYRTLQPLAVNGRGYPTEGYPPRHLLPEQLDPVPVTLHRGIPVFVEAGATAFTGTGGVFYVLLSPDCLFQPYRRAV